MAAETSKTRTCDECDANIPREDFLDHSAVRYKGKLLCAKCVQKVKARVASAKQAEEAAASRSANSDMPEPIHLPMPAAKEDDGKPKVVAGPSTQIHGVSGLATFKARERDYKRPLLKETQSATRCRTFHCKLTDASFANLNDQINEWVDESEEIEIKFALSEIGVVEGKHADPHMIVTVFY